MTVTGLRSFDSTLQLTHIWLDELMEEMHWQDRQRAYHGLRAVLHALRDRLTVDEATHLSAQLPMLVRGFFFEGWRPAEAPSKMRTTEEFFDCVSQKLDGDPTVDPQRLTRAVMHLLANHVTAGEIDDVKGMLPKGISNLWD